MEALIIGGAGFVGDYLINHLTNDCGWSIAITKLEYEMINNNNNNQVAVYDLNILDKKAVIDLLKKIRPRYIFHLAAQSSVSLSWKNPSLTVDVNIKGSLNVLEAVKELDYKPRLMLVGSGEEYGHILPEETPIKEHTPTRPGNIYAATKSTQNMIGKIYADAYQMDIIMVRAFNHIGPKQSPIFVVADFCKQVAEIEVGQREPIMMVGNLSAKRDFTDVRDVVKAYSLLIQHGVAGETYNVGSGKATSIADILKEILSHSNAIIDVQMDESRMRPVDVPIIEADILKLKECTKWENEINLRQTITDCLDYWRERVRTA